MGPKQDGPRIPGGSLTSVIGLAACAAILVGYFLPWTGLSPTVEDGLAMSKADVAREAAKIKTSEKDGSAAQRLADGVKLSGSEWAEVLDDFADSRDLNEKQLRALGAAKVGIRALPFVAAALALLLLLLAIPPGKAMRAGLGPIAAVLTIAHLRFVAAILLTVTMAMGVVVALVAFLLWKGATAGEDAAGAGRGVQLMVAGGGVAFLSQFLGYGPGRLRALLFAILLVIALVIAYVVLGR
ncbi:MAG: hypothetical protein ACYTG3_06930 [Planctomycetota bacterium]|jgi:hypothetical protein